MNHRPRKRFGQNFLHDANVIHKIVAAIAPRPNDRVVEIGPGLGALTRPLLEKLGTLDVVELDRDVIPELESACEGAGTLTIHNVDALRFDFAALAPAGEKLRVVGNLPYNISTPLIFHLLEQATHIKDLTFMLQKEVVDRLVATPGTRDFGRLSVMVQYRCRAEPLFIVKPGSFRPAPKVDSAVVRLTPYEAPPYPARDEALFSRLVNQAFTQRRKTLRNALKGFVDAAQLESLGVDPALRAEVLPVETFVTISNAVTDTTE